MKKLFVIYINNLPVTEFICSEENKDKLYNILNSYKKQYQREFTDVHIKEYELDKELGPVY